jgi:2'-5' RNA ligase
MSNEISMQKYRLFIAIPLPAEVKIEVEKAQGELRRAAPAECVRWTKPEQFHLTLRFLGDVEAEHLDALTRALQRACAGFPPLPLRAERIGFFPDPRRPRVVWMGVRDADGKLPLLQQAVVSAVAGFTREEPEGGFAGHVTLGRVKAIKRVEAEKMAGLARGMADRFFGGWTADKVQILRSELAPHGACHSTLAVVPLAGDPASGMPPQ